MPAEQPAASQHSPVVRLKVEGMSCQGCATAVAAALEAVPGVSRALVDLPGGTATIQTDRGIEASALVAAVERAGYTASAA